jgi:hypothetical protein
MAYITVYDTVFQGRVAGWHDEDNKPVIYSTYAEALIDANDDVMDAEDDPDDVVEVVVTDEQIYDPIDGRVYWSKKQ